METGRVMKGNHSRKTAAFVRVSPGLNTSYVGETSFRLAHVFPLTSRHVPPTVSSPSRRSAASSIVSTSTCCLVRLRWQASVSLRVSSCFLCCLISLFCCNNSSNSSVSYPWICSSSLLPLLSPFVFTSSWCFPKGSSQRSSRGSSLHQCGGETSLFGELLVGLHQQLPGHPASCPGNTIHILTCIHQNTQSSGIKNEYGQNLFHDMCAFAGSSRAWRALPGTRSAQYGSGLHLGRQQWRQGAGLHQRTAPAGCHEPGNLPLLHP